MAKNVEQAVAAALPMIREFEGLTLEAVRDRDGDWSIGYGHSISASEAQKGGRLMRIDEDQAERWLLEDAERNGREALWYVRGPVTVNQAAAVVSLAFNIGPTAFEGSSLLRKMNAGDAEGAAAEFIRWCHDGGAVVSGLVRRRAAERELFLKAGPMLEEVAQEEAGEAEAVPAKADGGLLAWVLSRGKEPSTWRGLGMLAAAAGLIAPGLVEVLVPLGVAVVGAVEAVRKEGA